MAEIPFFIPSSTTPVSTLTGTTLVLPQPSLSSLPQLAVDLYIHNYRLKKVGYLGLRDVVPCVGGNDSVEGEEETQRSEGFVMGIEVFQSANEPLTFVLPRAPIIQARKAQHLTALREWIQLNQFIEILVISSVDAAMRGDDNLRQESPYRSIILPTTSSISTALMGALSYLSPYSIPAEPVPSIPHGGLTRSLLRSLSSLRDVPVGALLVYTAEGDNASAAEDLASTLHQLLTGETRTTEWKKPKSWKLGLMGQELNRDQVGEMFG